jgi:outer membrane lipoprotein-sorting protein
MRSAVVWVLSLACAAICGVCPADAAAAAPGAGVAGGTIAGVDELLERMRGVQGVSARYREEKRMALLAVPLVCEGQLYYERPGRLARLQERPDPSRVVIDGDRLEFGDAGGRDTVDLAAQPVVRAFVDSFRLVLAGDRAALAAIYRLDFQAAGPGGPWTLTLTPRRAPLDRILGRIEVQGRGVALESVRILEVGGDETRIGFTAVDTARRFTAAERRRFFRLARG